MLLEAANVFLLQYGLALYKFVGHELLLLSTHCPTAVNQATTCTFCCQPVNTSCYNC